MTAAEPLPRVPGVHFSIRLCALAMCLVFGSGRVDAQTLSTPMASGQPEAWLMTYGPGDRYWQRFGHNAIWIRDPSRNIDHVFNSGFFDFRQPGFLKRFIQGRMLYFSAAQPATSEFFSYWNENRTVRGQQLALNEEEFERLVNHLVTQVQPQNRDYLYDYYLDNCSTRIRDALDIALNGKLSSATGSAPAGQNFRDHTRRSVENEPGYYFALELALGLPADRPISRWQEMFLPEVVAEVIGNFEHRGAPLVAHEQIMYQSSLQIPPGTPPVTWPMFLGFGILVLAFFAVLCRLAGPVMSLGSVNALLMISGSAGLVLAYLWLLTDHQASAPNSNLLLLNPLVLIGLHAKFRKPVAGLIAFGLVLSLILAMLPGGQYNLDVLALAGPLNIVAAWLLWSRDWREVRSGFGNPFRQDST